MELKQQVIHRKYNKAEAGIQVTVGEDYSIPEGKPDISKILQKKGEIQIEEVYTEKGKIKIRGLLKLRVFYLAERSLEAASCLETDFPFEETLYIEGAASGDNLKIDWNVEELKIAVVHPGKISVRALVNLKAFVTSVEECRITEEIGQETHCYTKTENFEMAEPVLDRKDSYRIREEVVLPVNKPNVQKILWKDLQLRGPELSIQENKLAIRGEVLFLVIYEGEEENGPVQWMEQNVPFHGTVEVSGMTPEMFGMIETEIAREEIELKPDYDGEMRMFQVELLLDIHMHIYEEHMQSVLKDVYSTKKRLIPGYEEIKYEKLRMCNHTKCRVSGQEEPEYETHILQILGQQAQLHGRRGRITEQGILREGTLEVQIIYVTADDSRPFGSMTVNLPYSQLIEIPGIKKEDLWKVSESVEQIAVTMPEGRRIEVKGTVSMNACVLEQCSLQNMTEVTEENYDREEYKNRPGMVIHFVQPGETLWDIAKEHLVTAEEVKKLNELAAEEVRQGQKLLLVKPAADIL